MTYSETIVDAYISKYEHFGNVYNSLAESGHFKVKSFLPNSTGYLTKVTVAILNSINSYIAKFHKRQVFKLNRTIVGNRVVDIIMSYFECLPYLISRNMIYLLTLRDS
jgi:hypothetical protein